jgi:hypothetical protein
MFLLLSVSRQRIGAFDGRVASVSVKQACLRPNSLEQPGWISAAGKLIPPRFPESDTPESQSAKVRVRHPSAAIHAVRHVIVADHGMP